MKIVTIIARILLGLMFFAFGLNPFLKFLPPASIGGGPDKALTGKVVLELEPGLAGDSSERRAGGASWVAPRYCFLLYRTD